MSRSLADDLKRLLPTVTERPTSGTATALTNVVDSEHAAIDNPHGLAISVRTAWIRLGGFFILYTSILENIYSQLLA